MCNFWSNKKHKVVPGIWAGKLIRDLMGSACVTKSSQINVRSLAFWEPLATSHGHHEDIVAVSEQSNFVPVQPELMVKSQSETQLQSLAKVRL